MMGVKFDKVGRRVAEGGGGGSQIIGVRVGDGRTEGGGGGGGSQTVGAQRLVVEAAPDSMSSARIVFCAS